MQKYGKLIGLGAALVVTIILLTLTVGINNSGYRTVIQYPNGYLTVKFNAGIYFDFFGKTTVYPDVITFDFDKLDAKEKATLDQKGISVRYQDGGTGKIYGLARFALPQDPVGMLEMHRAFRTREGVAYKLLKPTTEEALNLTAGLMTSEESYGEKRQTFTTWSKDQLQNGKYKTKLEKQTVNDEATGERVLRSIPVIEYGEDGLPINLDSDFTTYSVSLTGYTITDWDFEQKTLDQISKKREATMAIITSKAEAEQAKQEAITAEAKGKKAVTEARYEKEVEKQRAVTEAEQRAQVAKIEAQQKVTVAEQARLEAEQKKLTAKEYKEEQILRGEGDAEYKRLVMDADGALELKLKYLSEIHSQYADALSKNKIVPDVVIGGQAGSSDGGNQATDLINMLMIKTAKELAVDTQISK